VLARASLPVRCAAASLILVAAWSRPALAYRPFDGTDAAVAAPGELEVELQPAGVQHEQGTQTLIAPWTVLNIGLTEGWEAVFEGRGETPLSSSGPTALMRAGAFLKYVVVPGSLQDKSGPSVATEFGALLPDSTGGSGVGISWAGIVSQRSDWGAVHFNTEIALTRDHHADVFVGTILEGPAKWEVRPVAEIFYEKEFGLEETVSGLIGLIWQVNDKLSFDLAYRHALTNGHSVDEVRAGLTFAVPLRFEGAHNR
jgi:hypothetical protein